MDGRIVETQDEYQQLMRKLPKAKEHKLFKETGFFKKENGKLTMQWRYDISIELEIVTKDAPIEWESGLSDQLDQIPAGEMFFYESGYDGCEDISTNAMYLAKREW